MGNVYKVPANRIRSASFGSEPDDPQSDFWVGFEFGAPFFVTGYTNDFFTYLEDEWVETKTDPAAQVGVVDGHYGVLSLSNTAADDDLISLQLGGAGGGESFKAKSGTDIWFTCRLQCDDVTQSDILVGLVETDTTPFAHNNGIVFVKEDGSTSFDAQCTRSGTDAVEANIATAQDDQNITLSFRVFGADKVDFWVDGSRVAEISTATPITDLRPTIAIQNGEAAAKTLLVDYVACYQTSDREAMPGI